MRITEALSTLGGTVSLRVAVCLAFFVTGCSAGSSSASLSPASDVTPSAALAPSGAAANHITIKGFEFGPERLAVRAGATVTWTNRESSLHTVTSGTPDDRTSLFDSGEFDTGERFDVTFAEAGSFPYFCDRHEFMRGEVVVAP